jgi:membrane-associated phospholipid phosphatase
MRKLRRNSIAGLLARSHIPGVSRIISVGGNVLFLLLTAAPFCSSRAQEPDRIDSLLKAPAQDGFNKPRAFAFIRNFPGDMHDYSKATFRKQNLLKIGAMVLGTAALVKTDQNITDGAYWFGDRLDLSHSSHQKTYLHISFSVRSKRLSFPIGAPDNVGTAMYFLGDGITHFSIAGSFLAYGLMKNDNRAEQTASELTEAIITTGFATQLLKHVSGRESPFVSTARGGVWKVFPNQADYARHTPHYDAFPSGHLATAMATVTVISGNYPEYRFIKPIGYSMMTLLSYEMLNNKVHWASDYPLALALGDTFAKIAIKKGHTETKRVRSSEAAEEKTEAAVGSLRVEPYLGARGAGVTVAVRF